MFELSRVDNFEALSEVKEQVTTRSDNLSDVAFGALVLALFNSLVWFFVIDWFFAPTSWLFPSLFIGGLTAATFAALCLFLVVRTET